MIDWDLKIVSQSQTHVAFSMPSNPLVSNLMPDSTEGEREKGQNHDSGCAKREQKRWQIAQDPYILAAHALSNVAEYANVIRELLLDNTDTSAIWTIQTAAKLTCSSKKRFMSLNLPVLDAGLVECKIPY